MTVSINLPDRISFEAKTEDLGDVLVKPFYKKPFNQLAQQLYRYFPLLPDGKGATTHVL